LSENYNWAFKFIPNKPRTIVEVGSRDALDALTLQSFYDSDVIAFEANLESYKICLENLSAEKNTRIQIRNQALTNRNEPVTFWKVDPDKYSNVGASSLLKIDFKNRPAEDADFNREEVQIPEQIQGVRWDSLGLSNPDLLVLDVEGAELQVLQGFGSELKYIEYVILEVAPISHHIDGTNFKEINRFMRLNGFQYRASDAYGAGFIRLLIGYLRGWRHSRVRNMFKEPTTRGFFNVLYVNKRR
jgi:FkbM family methyltransferase